MRLIGEVTNAAHARTFAAWLLTHSIESQVDGREEGPFEIWVKDEDQFQQAKELLAQFQANPDDKQFVQATAKANEILREQQRRQKQLKKNVVKVSPGARTGTLWQIAPLTVVLIAICAVVALLTEFGDSRHFDRAVFRALQFVAVDSPSPELVQMAATQPDNPQSPTCQRNAWRVLEIGDADLHPLRHLSPDLSTCCGWSSSAA